MKQLLPIFFILCFQGAFAQTFTIIDTLPPGQGGAAAWGDYDNDGLKDLVYMTSPNSGAAPFCTVYHNVHDSFIALPQVFPYLQGTAKWADLNNDGFDDLVIMGYDMATPSGKLYIYKSNGDGTFTEMPNTLSPLDEGCMDIIDYNNDGLKDIAIAGYDTTFHPAAFIYKNMGGFVFSNIHAPLIPSVDCSMQWGDFNNDHLPDLVINGREATGSAKTRIYQNMGADSFMLLPLNMRGSIDGAVGWIDYDGDGKPDLIVNGNDTSGTINFTDLYHNNGSGSFSQVATNLPPYGESSYIAIADFNNDGKPDACFIGGIDTIAVLLNSSMALNTGTNAFDVSDFIFTYQAPEQPIIQAVDIDNDGDQDLILNNIILRNDHITNAVSKNNMIPLQMQVSPNPANDVLNVHLPVKNATIALYGVTGKQAYSKHNANEDETIDLHNFPPGTYLLKASINNTITLTQKVVISR